MYSDTMRKYPTHTPLGQIMAEAGLQVTQLSAISGVYNRTLTEYLAGRKQWVPGHLAKVSEALNVDPEDLIYVPEMADVQ